MDALHTCDVSISTNLSMSCDCVGEYFSLTRAWTTGDELSLALPLGLRFEKIQGMSTLTFKP